MEPYLRGSIEGFLDTTLEKHLVVIQKLVDTLFAPLVKSIEDAMCGYVVGRTVQFAFDIIGATEGRKPTDKEFEDIGKIVSRRALEIREQVRKTLSR